MKAPVVLFVYNRLDHTMNVIDSLSKNLGACDTDLYVFSDAAKTEKGQDKVNAVREYIHKTDWRNGFKKVTKRKNYYKDEDGILMIKNLGD